MTLVGIDLSSYQATIDLSKIRFDFALIKATGGNGYVNPACDRLYQQAKALGKLLGLYHFAHESGFQSDPVTEADFFVNNIKGYLADGGVNLVLDFEGDNSKDVGWSKTFLDRVFVRTGIRPIIYLNTAELAQSDWSPVFKANYGLWVARYAVTSPTQGYNNYLGTPAVNDAPPAVNWGGVGPVMWQFADNAQLPGYAGGLDADILYGDAATWHAYAKPVGTPAPVSAPHPAPAPTPPPAPRPVPVPAVLGKATVTSGDTFSSIAAQVGVSLAALEAVNPHIDYNHISPGQVINLPAGANLRALSGFAPAPSRPAGLPPYCTVTSGDTLTSIANQFHTSLGYILAHNPGINANLIFVGQRINF